MLEEQPSTCGLGPNQALRQADFFASALAYHVILIPQNADILERVLADHCVTSPLAALHPILSQTSQRPMHCVTMDKGLQNV